MIPTGKYCNGCSYLDTMLYYNCMLLIKQLDTDGEARYLKHIKCPNKEVTPPAEGGMKPCKRCGKPPPLGSRICPHCGKFN